MKHSMKAPKYGHRRQTGEQTLVNPAKNADGRVRPGRLRILARCVVVVVSSLLLLLFCGAFSFIFPKIPSQSGLTLQQAQQTVRSCGAQPVAVPTQSDEAYGTVIGQSPGFLGFYLAGKPVELYYSVQQPTAQVPALTGLTLADGLQALFNQELYTVQITLLPADTQNSGIIRSQSLPAGQSVERTQEIILYVAADRQQSCTLPAGQIPEKGATLCSGDLLAVDTENAVIAVRQGTGTLAGGFYRVGDTQLACAILADCGNPNLLYTFGANGALSPSSDSILCLQAGVICGKYITEATSARTCCVSLAAGVSEVTFAAQAACKVSLGTGTQASFAGAGVTYFSNADNAALFWAGDQLTLTKNCGDGILTGNLAADCTVTSEAQGYVEYQLTGAHTSALLCFTQDFPNTSANFYAVDSGAATTAAAGCTYRYLGGKWLLLPAA